MHSMVRRLVIRVLVVALLVLFIFGAGCLIRHLSSNGEAPDRTIEAQSSAELAALFGAIPQDIRLQVPESQLTFVKQAREAISPLCLTLYKLNDPDLPEEGQSALIKETLRQIETCNARIDPVFQGANDWIARVELDTKGENCDFALLIAQEDLAQRIREQNAPPEFLRVFSSDGTPRIYFTITFRTPLAQLSEEVRRKIGSGDYVRFTCSKARPAFTMGTRALWIVNVSNVTVVKKQ